MRTTRTQAQKSSPENILNELKESYVLKSTSELGRALMIIGKSFPNDPWFLKLKGFYYIKVHEKDLKHTNLDLALSYFKSANDLTPNDPFVNYYLGYIYNRKKQFRDALMCLNMAHTIEGDNPVIFNERGRTKFELEDYSGALIDLNRSNRLSFKDETISLIDETMEKLRDIWAEDHPEPGYSPPLPNELFSQYTQGVDILTLSLVCKEWIQLVYSKKIQGSNKHSVDWKNAFVISVIAWIRDEKLYEDIFLDDRADIQIYPTKENDTFESIVYSRYCQALQKSTDIGHIPILKRLLKIRLVDLRIDSDNNPYNKVLMYAIASEKSNEEAEKVISQAENLSLNILFNYYDEFPLSLIRKNKLDLLKYLWTRHMKSRNNNDLYDHMIEILDFAFQTDHYDLAEWVLEQHPEELPKHVILLRAAYYGCIKMLYWWHERYGELSHITYQEAICLATQDHQTNQTCTHTKFVITMDELFPYRVPSNESKDKEWGEPFYLRDPCN